MKPAGFCLLLLAALAAPGCVRSVRAPYPASWPAVEALPKKACPDIAGTYENFGLTRDEKSGAQKGTGPLQTALGIPDETKRGVRVTVAMPSPGILEIVLSEPSELPAELTALPIDELHTVPFLRTSLREGHEFHCGKEGLSISRTHWGWPEWSISEIASEWVAGHLLGGTAGSSTASQFHRSSVTAHFRRAEDGSLIVKSEERFTGLVMTTLPATWTKTSWAKFKISGAE